jgi:multidrug efflux pump subunit AcrA (membrane-fusion protein)
MQVQVALNESVVDRVAPGQRVSVSFEALPSLVMKGTVRSVGQIPFAVTVRSGGGQGMDTGVRFFTCFVKLDKTTDDLKPGMSAMVDFALSRRQNVLAVRHEAVRTDHGKKICYVAHDEKLERREVKIGQDTADLVEVIDGLREGELVALNPPPAADQVPTLTSFDKLNANNTAVADHVAASGR